MEHNRSQKLLMIIALVLSIASLSIGFAAFSVSLNISSSASVNPSSETFSVKFSTSQTDLVVGAVSPSSNPFGLTTSNGTIVNGASPTLSNLSATFTSPGQYVEYTVYARNQGEYTAYLNNINFIGNKTCVASTGTTDSLVQSACESINVIVTIGSTSYDDTTPITVHPLAKKAGEVVKVRLEYAENGTVVDGSFQITFPSISLVYSTVDNPSTVGKVIRVVSGDINTPGSVVSIGSEQFYVIGQEDGNVKLLSMYNLHVGNSVDEDWNVTPLSNPTGIQNSSAIGLLSDPPFIGITTFSDVSSAYSGSIVEGYVKNYAAYLEGLGVNISLARLITKEELEILGCSTANYTCSGAPSWVYSTSYWSSSTRGYFVWGIYRYSQLVLLDYYNDVSAGVRPVIEISESEF